MRLNTAKQREEEPERFKYALQELDRLGYYPKICEDDPSVILIPILDRTIRFWPYSGWHSGKGIKAGRGIKELILKLRELRLNL